MEDTEDDILWKEEIKVMLTQVSEREDVIINERNDKDDEDYHCEFLHDHIYVFVNLSLFAFFNKL